MKTRESKRKKESSSPSENKSEIKTRMKIQELLNKNMRTPIGMFHGKELNERCFVNDLFKYLDISIKE